MKSDKINIFSGKISLFRWFPLGVVQSPRRLFFRLNYLRIVWKRCSHSTVRSQATRRSKSVSSGFVPQQQIRCSMRIEHNKLKYKNRDIFRWDIYYSSCLLSLDHPDPIASCGFKPFQWFTNYAQLSTYLWKTCLQRIIITNVDYMLTEIVGSSFTARGWSEWIMQRNIFAVLWTSTLFKSHISVGERIISCGRAETNHDKLPRQIHIAHNVHKLPSRVFAFHEEIFKLQILLNQGRSIFFKETRL